MFGGLIIRPIDMKRVPYGYIKNGLDKRQELSLEEIFDLTLYARKNNKEQGRDLYGEDSEWRPRKTYLEEEGDGAGEIA